MAWRKRGNARNITEAFKEISRLSMEDVTLHKSVSSETIVGMEDAADLINIAVRDKIPVTVVGDYDVDGISSTAILWYMLRYLGINAHLRLPRRYTEGYGLSMRVVDEVDEGLLITVDNGIAAIEPIRCAKEKGLRVIILDHHLPGKELPNADVIVDPHIAPEQSGFSDYCGAGLAFKLSQLLIDDNRFLKKMCALAAVGTIADVVPLVGDNHCIAREGLRYINQREIPVGLLALINATGLKKIDEQNIGFTIAPMLNAAGRLEDTGAEKSLDLLIMDDYAEAEEKAYELIEINEKRKSLVKSAMERAHKYIRDNHMEEKNPICIYDQELLSGIAGLLAGRLAEEYQTPAIVLAPSGQEGTIKGSGRTYGGVHLRNLLESAEEYLLNYGGHEKAAGLGLRKGNLSSFTEKLELLLKDYNRPEQGEYLYDLEVNAEEIPRIMEDLEKYAPFGEGNPRPVIRVDRILLLPQAGKLYRLLGNQKEHIRLLGREFSVMAFHKAAEYIEMGEPDVINVIGYLVHTNYRRNSQIEIEAIAFEESEKKENESTALQQEMLLHFMQFAEERR